MLITFPDHAGRSDDLEALKAAHWIDLVDPTREEIARVEQAFGIAIPTRESLLEIEASSGLRAREGILYLSAPLIAGTDGDHWQLAPTGFILNGNWLVTIRFAEFGAFDAVRNTIARDDCTAPQILIFILEEIVDRAADFLERAAEGLTEVSTTRPGGCAIRWSGSAG